MPPLPHKAGRGQGKTFFLKVHLQKRKPGTCIVPGSLGQRLAIRFIASRIISSMIIGMDSKRMAASIMFVPSFLIDYQKSGLLDIDFIS